MRESDKLQYEVNKEEIKERRYDYRGANRDQINEHAKEYRRANKELINARIMCECGCEISRRQLKRHCKSDKHKKRYEEQIIYNIMSYII